MEDAEQEILLALFLDIKRFRFQSGFQTYFYRFSKNKAVDILRKMNRERKKQISFDRHRSKSFGVDPEHLAIRNDVRKRVFSALFQLNPEDRLILFMKDVEEHSIRSISSVMNLTHGAVKSRLHRSRKRMIKILACVAVSVAAVGISFLVAFTGFRTYKSAILIRERVDMIVEQAFSAPLITYDWSVSD